MDTAQKLKQAREQRAAAFETVQKLGEKLQLKSWDEEKDGKALEEAQASLRTLETDVNRLEGLLDTEARSAQWQTPEPPAPTDPQRSQAPAIIKNTGDNPDEVRENYRFMDAVRTLSGQKKMEGLIKEMHEEADREMRAAGVSEYGTGVLIPMMVTSRDQGGVWLTRDMTAGSDTAGGHTIETELRGLIPFLDPRNILRRIGATYLPDLVGDLKFPRNDGAATAVWNTEQGTADETNPTFDEVTMTPKRLAAFTDISMQVMRQSSIAMENFVRNRLLQARDNALDVAGIAGTGSSNQPTGIKNTSGVTNISLGAAPTWADIVEFETTIAANDADFGNLAYLTTPGLAGKLKTVKRDTAGNMFIWEGPNLGGGQVNGYNAVVSTLVPSDGGGHDMYFGNWAKLMIGQWGAMELTTNPFTKLKEATVEVVLNTFHDIGVEHGAAFAYTADAHTS